MTLSSTAKCILSALLFLIGVAICIAASLVATYQTAKVMPRIGVLTVVALLVFFLCVLLTTECAGKLNKTFLNRNAVFTSVALTAFLLSAFTSPCCGRCRTRTSFQWPA